MFFSFKSEINALSLHVIIGCFLTHICSKHWEWNEKHDDMVHSA